MEIKTKKWNSNNNNNNNNTICIAPLGRNFRGTSYYDLLCWGPVTACWKPQPFASERRTETVDKVKVRETTPAVRRSQ